MNKKGTKPLGIMNVDFIKLEDGNHACDECFLCAKKSDEFSDGQCSLPVAIIPCIRKNLLNPLENSSYVLKAIIHD